MANQRYALISVSDKTGIQEVAGALVKQGIILLSTGGTYRTLEKAGLPVQSVESITQFPEMMDGRVKTLHPKIHGGLLGLRDNIDHLKAMETYDISPIDFVIVNLYPFKETIQQADCELGQAIEQIDIGGPSMLRSAAKNYASVTVVTDPRDYGTLIEQLEEEGKTSLEYRAYLAQKVYQLTAHYDALIARYLSQQLNHQHNFASFEWDILTLTYQKSQDLRYGENSHQAAAFYSQVDGPAYSIANAQQLHGKALSYNNIKDADAAIKIAREFSDPCAVAVKHMNPCGVAIGERIEEAFERCYQADPVSIFGGILVLNRPVSLALAEKIHALFIEMIIAPNFEDEAFELLSDKANIRLLKLDFDQASASYQDEYVSVIGGMLVQNSDQSNELALENPVNMPDEWEVMTQRQPTSQELAALNFNLKVCKHVKSNAIVVGNSYMTLGIGAGQMNRVGAAQIALDQAKAKLQELSIDEPLVLASDAFFPMDDTVKLAQAYGVSAIGQPGGSLRDQDSVLVCNQANIAMVKTQYRHFRH